MARQRLGARTRAAAVGLLWAAMGVAVAARGADSPFDRAKVFLLPPTEEHLSETTGRTWDLAAPGHGNFTTFHGVRELGATDDGALRFVLDGEEALLGWGNYADKQPRADRVEFWNMDWRLRLQARQSAPGPTAWEVRGWSQGNRLPAGTNPNYSQPTAELQGTDWQTLNFKIQNTQNVSADGFEITIRAEPGTAVEIRDLTVLRVVHKGYLRKEFTLPGDRVWRAVVDVGAKTVLYVNGEEIPDRKSVSPRPRHGYWSDPVDITEHLRPGRNCIGVFGTSLRSTYPPYCYLQGRAVMVSGRTALLDSDETWRWSPRPEPGWSAVGFDDSAWAEVGASAGDENAAAVRGGRWMRSYRDGYWYRRPGYDGYMALTNPGENRLFFSASEPVGVEVRVPAGLAERAPWIEWSVDRYDGGEFVPEAEGRADEYAARDASLVYTVQPGALEGGVYLLRMTLRSADEVIEVRPAEPFLVVRRLPMDTVAGDTYEQGLDLELEDTVDFTDLDDPHPVLETDAQGDPLPPEERTPWEELPARQQQATARQDWEARQQEHAAQAALAPQIVQRDGLRYRETRPYMGAHFSCLVEFAHPGDFYLLVLEYPNDDDRWIGAVCTEPAGGTSKCCPTVWTGDKYPLTNTMRELKWLLRPTPGKHAIDVMSLRKESAAAAARLRIYHVAGPLPALRAPEDNARWIGILTETSDNRKQSFDRTFRGAVPEALARMRAAGLPADEEERLLRFCGLLSFWLDTCEHYAAYLRFTGQNLHGMGAWQYSDSQAITKPPNTDSPRVLRAFREIAARVFRENGVDFLASVQFVFSSGLIAASERGEGRIPGIEDTMYLVDNQGRKLQTGRSPSYRAGWNFNHPRVREEMRRVAHDLADKFGPLPNFLGLNWSVYFGCDYLPVYRARAFKANSPYLAGSLVDPLLDGYGDATIYAFEQDTDLDLPIGYQDPDRFQKRYTLLTSPRMRERWISWRCERLRGCFSDLVDEIQQTREDLFCTASLMFYAGHGREWHASGLPLKDFLRRWGWDPALFAEAEDLWPTHWMHASPHSQPKDNENYPYMLDINAHEAFHEAFAHPTNRAAMVQHAWQEPEGHAWRLPYRAGWPRPGDILAQAEPSGDYAREAFVQALIGGDPRLVLFSLIHVNLHVGQEQELREFARVLRSLPAERFSPVLDTGLDTNLAIRCLHGEDALTFYVANPGYWPVTGTVTVQGDGEVRDLVANEVVAPEAAAADAVSVPVRLDPYGVAAFRVQGVEARLTGWDTDPLDDQHLAHIRGMLGRVEELLGIQRARLVLTEEGLAFMESTVRRARADLAEGRVARAWHAVANSSRFYVLREYLERGASYGTEKKRGESVTTEMRTLQVPAVAQAPEVDGELDDAAWRQAASVEGFVMTNRFPAIVGTRMYALRHGQDLYLGFECRDPEPEAIKRDAVREDEGTVFRDDCVALFLRLDLDEPVYYQMAVSAGGVRFDQRVVGGARDYEFAPPWQAATAIGDDAWTLEVRLPADSLGADLEAGDTWGFNAHRSFRFGSVPASSWSYTIGSWHDEASFGRLTFE